MGWRERLGGRRSHQVPTSTPEPPNAPAGGPLPLPPFAVFVGDHVRFEGPGGFSLGGGPMIRTGDIGVVVDILPPDPEYGKCVLVRFGGTPRGDVRLNKTSFDSRRWTLLPEDR